MADNKNVTVTYNPTGSGAGIQAVAEGRCDIGLASRNLKDEEKANLDETVVAIDGIAVIVNKENPVTDLTIEQIATVYKGEISKLKRAWRSRCTDCFNRQRSSIRYKRRL